MRKYFLPIAILLLFSIFPHVARAESSPVLATVNGEKIDADRLHLYMLSQGIPEQEWPTYEKQLLEQLIDRTLIRQFLESRKVTAPKATLERQLAIIEKVLRNVDSPEAILEKLGMTREDLVRELSLPLAWRRYVQQVITEREIAEYFQQHRKELDGTQRQARQIFIKLPKNASSRQVDDALNQLAELKNRIERKELSFAEAAREYSQSPSAKQGGELGTFAFTGQMPVEIARHVFQTDVKQISQPFRTRFGAHLVYVEKEIPGLLSLEDARPEILSHLIEAKWRQTVKRLRKSARLSYHAN